MVSSYRHSLLPGHACGSPPLLSLVSPGALPGADLASGSLTTLCFPTYSLIYYQPPIILVHLFCGDWAVCGSHRKWSSYPSLDKLQQFPAHCGRRISRIRNPSPMNNFLSAAVMSRIEPASHTKQNCSECGTKYLFIAASKSNKGQQMMHLISGLNISSLAAGVENRGQQATNKGQQMMQSVSRRT